MQGRSLHLEDLALARACAQGSQPAWECFVARYREKLYAAASAIAKDPVLGKELADSLYADLFGMRCNADGERISRLASYTGRGSLEAWLRAVLAQEYVNRYRGERRLTSMDTLGEGERIQAETLFPDSVADPRLADTVEDALTDLTNEERLILATYYLDGRSLAEIGAMLGLHESTVSRRIHRTTATLRKRILRGLQKRGMSKSQAEELLQTDVCELQFDHRVLNIRARLIGERSEAEV